MPEPMDAVPTTYASTRFRSRLEADWAVTLDGLGILWEYEPELIVLPSGTQYVPDFWLPEVGTWLEVKGPNTPRREKATELGKVRACHCTGACSCRWPAGQLVLLGWPSHRSPNQPGSRPLRSRLVGRGVRPKRLPHRMPVVRPCPPGHPAQAVAVPRLPRHPRRHAPLLQPSRTADWKKPSCVRHSATFPVAQLLAGALTGLVAARTGYSGTFWCGAALCALACVLLRARGRAGRNLPG